LPASISRASPSWRSYKVGPLPLQYNMRGYQRVFRGIGSAGWSSHMRVRCLLLRSPFPSGRTLSPIG
jgi:hypothetical protein